MATRILKTLRTTAEGPGGDPRAELVCLSLRHLVTVLYWDHYPKGENKTKEQWLSQVLEAFASVGDGLSVMDRLGTYLLTEFLPNLIQNTDIHGLLDQVTAVIGDRSKSDPTAWVLRRDALVSALNTSYNSHRDRSLDNDRTMAGLVQETNLTAIQCAQVALTSSCSPDSARLMILFAASISGSATVSAARMAEPGAPLSVLGVKGKRAQSAFYLDIFRKVLELLEAPN